MGYVNAEKEIERLLAEVSDLKCQIAAWQDVTGYASPENMRQDTHPVAALAEEPKPEPQTEESPPPKKNPRMTDSKKASATLHHGARTSVLPAKVFDELWTNTKVVPQGHWHWKDGKNLLAKIDTGPWGERFVTWLTWTLANGSVPDAMGIVQTCNDESCINPAHMTLKYSAFNKEVSTLFPALRDSRVVGDYKPNFTQGAPHAKKDAQTKTKKAQAPVRDTPQTVGEPPQKAFIPRSQAAMKAHSRAASQRKRVGPYKTVDATLPSLEVITQEFPSLAAHLSADFCPPTAAPVQPAKPTGPAWACGKGHTPEDAFVRGDGKMECRQCRRDRQARGRERLRESQREATPIKESAPVKKPKVLIVSTPSGGPSVHEEAWRKTWRD